MSEQTAPITAEVKKTRKFLAIYNVSQTLLEVAKWLNTLVTVIFVWIAFSFPWDEATLLRTMFWFIMAVLYWTNAAHQKERKRMSSVIVELST